ncbi:aspartic protease 2, partial [Aphelenchoides avenae]
MDCGSSIETVMAPPQSEPSRGCHKRANQLSSVSQDVSVYYVGEVQIGTPPQTFVVQLDPSSPNLWVGSAEPPPCHGFGCDVLLKRCPGYCRDKVFCTSLCEESCCDGSGGPIKDQYQSSASSTYKSDDNEFRSDKYEAFGEYGIDTVRIGNSQQIVLPGIRLGMASETGTDFADLPADGVLGLSTFAAGEDSSKEKPFVQQLVDSGVLQKSLYTVYLAADAKAE